MKSQKIAILGFGAMGSRIAQNLLNAEYQVVVYNRTVDRVQPLLNQGVTYAATPEAAAEQADIIVSMVTDDDGSRKVWLDPESGAWLGNRKQILMIRAFPHPTKNHSKKEIYRLFDNRRVRNIGSASVCGLAVRRVVAKADLIAMYKSRSRTGLRM